MHDAFEPVPILEKLPLQIDCLAAWGESEDRGPRRGPRQRGSGTDPSQAGGSGRASGGAAPAGRRPKGNRDEGEQSIVDSEGPEDHPLGSTHFRDVPPALALGAELEAELSLIVLSFGLFRFPRSL